MNTNTAVWIVSIIVVFVFFIEYVYPWALLSRQKNNYIKSVIECELAKDAQLRAGDLEGQLEIGARSQLKKSIYISLENCNKFQKLKANLLSGGINLHALDYLRLKALEDKKISLNNSTRALKYD